MPAADLYSLDVPVAFQLVEGAASTQLRAPVMRDGSQVAATSATLRLYNRLGELVKTVTGVDALDTGVPKIDVTSADLANQDRGTAWRVELDLVLTGGVEFRGQLDAVYVRRDLSPVVTLADVYGPKGRHKMLNPAHPRPATKLTVEELQGHLDEAWVIIRHRLDRRGDRADLVMSPTAFREVHLYQALALIFDDAAAQTGDEYLDRARDYRDMFESSWDAMTWVTDDNDDGVPDRSGKRRGAVSHVWLT